MTIDLPAATYRIQFSAQFPLRAAQERLAYWQALGVSHLYASPLFAAAPGSLHGYDVCDFNRFNPEITSREDFDGFIEAAHGRGLRLILDFVPNHMGLTEGLNLWWTSVLENGPSSLYADYFDVDWHPLKRELEGKVLLPILGGQYGEVLESGAFGLSFERGAFHLHYANHRLPLAPESTRSILHQTRARVCAAGHDPPAELASILTALEYLPDQAETHPSRKAEREREKEIIKGRLAKLCINQAGIRTAIEDRLTQLQAGGAHGDYFELDQLLGAQAYRLAYWRVAAEEINYRRFFDVNALAALKMELPEVFRASHRLLRELIARGAVSGLRLDHIDGLLDPGGYLEQLRALCRQSPDGFYLLVEKILAPGETLPREWPVDGSTGYEFGAQVTALLLDAQAAPAFNRLYHRFIGHQHSYKDLIYHCKRLTMEISLASELNALGHLLSRIASAHRCYRDFTLNALTAAVREVVACFPVYRTYLGPQTCRPDDRRIVLQALATARRRNPALERTVFEFLGEVLLPALPKVQPLREDLRREFVGRFQQFTAPMWAKAVEDTGFYIYNRMLALNEVGADPAVFGLSPAHFHQQNQARQAAFPHCLLSTSTHDSKRSEDVRARLVALSELPELWQKKLRHWHRLNRRFRQRVDGQWAPDPNEEYLLYQTLLGTWPLEAEPDWTDYSRRIRQYMAKALHEAKVHSSWLEPNHAWDQALDHFVSQLLDRQSPNPFLQSFLPLQEQIARLGAINSLSQTVLKLTCPGVPDFYQGQEWWNFSLVDPDNRRPVPFRQLEDSLRSLQNGLCPETLLADWRNGRLKLFLIWKLLQLRRQLPELFHSGDYRPISAEGERSSCCVAFERSYQDRRLIVVIPRLTSQLGFPPVGAVWGRTSLAFPEGAPWQELFTAQWLPKTDRPYPLHRLLRTFPVAVYSSSSTTPLNAHSLPLNIAVPINGD